MPLSEGARAVADWAARVVRPIRWVWRSSLALRVVSTTLVLSLTVLGLMGVLLMGRITSGLLDAKEKSSLAEASSGLSQAQQVLTGADTGASTPAVDFLVDKVITSLAQRAGSPGLYEVLLLATPPHGAEAPERGTNLVLESSVPAALRGAVVQDARQSWTYTQIRYLGGHTTPGLVVGAPLDIPSSGNYELYYLFPLDGEQGTLTLVHNTVIGVGILLVLTLGLISYVVTRQVVSPVRQAARTAERLAAGHLTERMTVTGQDDLARLAASFNDMAASLQLQIRRLESLSRVQQRFVSDVSHELRTPLTTVRMAADVLYEARPDFDAVTARSAELLQNQLDRFEALLSDLLEISRFDAGAAVLDVEQIDIAGMVARACESATPLAERHGSQLRVELDSASVLTECDPRRIDRVLRNLIANAIEHGAGKDITVRVKADDDAVAVGVRDRGVGLKPGESSLVFNRFWRADPARARTIGGTGLGLSIALEDARLHGGWLQAWGAPAAGAHFRLTLPRTAGGALEESPLPLEPDDVVAQQARNVAPYARNHAEGSGDRDGAGGGSAGTEPDHRVRT